MPIEQPHGLGAVLSTKAHGYQDAVNLGHGAVSGSGVFVFKAKA